MVKLESGKLAEISRGYQHTTNNRMELMAVIAALESIDPGSPVRLFSDSKYVVDALIQGWAKKWRAAGWRRKGANRIANADLWKRLLELNDQFEVAYEWVKGHAGNEHNERADALSYQAIADSGKLEDKGFSRQRLAKTEARGRITQAGQPCRKCGTPVEKQVPRRRLKPDQNYYFEYYLRCPNCGTNYMVDEAKRFLDQDSMF